MTFDPGISEWDNPAGGRPVMPLMRQATAGN